MVEKILFSEQEIALCIERLARQISEDYAGRDLVLVSILKGSVVFLSDLIRKITVPCSVDFMSISSYKNRAVSSGIVRLELDLRETPEHKDLLLVEDILDSGLTLEYVLKNLKVRNLRSLRVCTLLDKPKKRKTNVRSDYTGFSIDDHFVVGYGLDYAEKFRNLPYIGILSKESQGKV